MDHNTVKGEKDDVNVQENVMNSEEIKTKKRKKSIKHYLVPKIGCLRVEKDEEGDVDFRVVVNGDDDQQRRPTHLVVMVNGIIGSPDNWKYAAKQFLKMYPRDVIVHCSKSNYSTLTFDGVDVMGNRLAEEVIEVVKEHPYLQKISFIGHSLGGLITRYAIAKLYEQNEVSQTNADECKGNDTKTGDNQSVEDQVRGKIAGLEPMNFITSATPHLGSRWHKQVPMFGGLHSLENMAARLSWFLGRTGKHLFLMDGQDGKPPLLLQMVRDSRDLKFMSALQSFERRVVYANVHFDNMVGWSTSSLRQRTKLPRRRNLVRDEKYRHIVHFDASKTANPKQEAALEAQVNGSKTMELEEEMITALTKMSWERNDVKFNGTKQRFLAHGTIQVQRSCINAGGADVVQHMVDNFLL